MKEAEVKRKCDKTGKNERVRPEWAYGSGDGKPETRNPGTIQLEMLESIRNTLEGILAVLKDSEIVYMRGKGDKNG